MNSFLYVTGMAGGSFLPSTSSGRTSTFSNSLFLILDTQRAIVAEIEEVQHLINANKELIHIFEEKIKATINRVWGEERRAEMKGEILMAAEEGAKYGK